jgi:PII-like signaling protein
MIFVDETDKYHGANLAAAIIDRLKKEGCSGATVLKGIAGFGVHKQVHTAAILDLSISLPDIIVAIESEEKIAQIMPIIEEMVAEGLIVIDDVQTIKLSKG